MFKNDSPIIRIAFGNSAQRLKIPATDTGNGGVNYDKGYATKYEQDLKTAGSGALPVERLYFNYMLWNTTQLVREWQVRGVPVWQADITDGYPANATVIYQAKATDPYYLYVSLVDQNTAVPGNTDFWDAVPFNANWNNTIPMPFGGGVGGTVPGIILGNGVDFNAIATSKGNIFAGGTFFVGDDATMAKCSNGPYPVGGVQACGLFETFIEKGSAPFYGMQRFTTRTNIIFWRSFTGSTYTPWRATADYADTQMGDSKNCFLTNIGGNVNELTGDCTPPINSLPEGTILKFRLPPNSTTNNRVYLTIGALPRTELVRCDNGSMADLWMRPSSWFTAMYTNGKWWMDFAFGSDNQQLNIGLGTAMMPIGGIIMWPIEDLPKGYIKCNGASITRAQYPELVTLLTGNTTAPSVNVVDLRGEFVRGWDDGRNVDPGRVIRSWQERAITSHTHTGTTDVKNLHQHPGSQTNGDGAHIHYGVVDGNGTHNHADGIRAPGAWRGDSITGSDNSVNYGVNMVGDAGWHNHAMNTPGGQGAHAHWFTTGWAGDHAHTFTTDNNTGPNVGTNYPRNVALQFIMRAL